MLDINNTHHKIDFIGDIHGHADELRKLLKGLNYNNENGVYKHAERKAFFVGDFIDRGPKIRETLEIVKGMCDAGEAFTVMGNHEYNAICFDTMDKDGKPLRAHSEKNKLQHKQTLNEFAGYKKEWEMYLNWFKTLPLYFENSNFRVVHACWDNKHIKQLKGFSLKNIEDKNFLLKSSKKKNVEFKIVEESLKGKEVNLKGEKFNDKDGNLRKRGRIKWWMSPTGLKARDFIFEFPGMGKNFEIKVKNEPYPSIDPPVFFGHYWLKGNIPLLMADNVCCLDYSVAKEGILCAYSWNGERKLKEENFKWV